MSSVRIREGDLAGERAIFLAFIDGLQEFEHRFEPNRRVDATVAADHLAVLTQRLAEYPGTILVAEEPGGTIIGWAVVHESDDDLYVVETERRFAYIAELFVTEAARSTGAGKALIEACERWARDRGLPVMQIGVLPANVRAEAVYRRAGFAHYAYQLRKYLR